MPILGIRSGTPYFKANENVLDMRPYTITVNLSAGANTTITTTISSTKRNIYSVEFIDSSGNLITTGLGQPIISSSGGVWIITVYSVDALTGVIVRVIYK